MAVTPDTFLQNRRPRRRRRQPDVASAAERLARELERVAERIARETTQPRPAVRRQVASRRRRTEFRARASRDPQVLERRFRRNVARSPEIDRTIAEQLAQVAERSQPTGLLADLERIARRGVGASTGLISDETAAAGRRTVFGTEDLGPAEIATAIGLPPILRGAQLVGRAARTGTRATSGAGRAEARAAARARGERVPALRKGTTGRQRRQAARRARARRPEGRAAAEARDLRRYNRRRRGAQAGLAGLTGTAALDVAGARIGGERPLVAAGRLGTAPAEVARAFAEDPGGVTSQSLSTGRDILLGLPQALVTAATDPKHAGEMILEDIEHRYGPLVKGDREEFRRRVREEGGITPFALDALVVGVPAGGLAGGAARAGALGRRVQRAATTPRRPIRTAAGAAEVPPLSRNLGVAAGQKTADIARQRRTRRRRRRGDPLAAEAIRSGQSVPFLPGRGIRRELGRAQGRAFIQLTREQAEEIAGGIRKDMRPLSHLQREALKYVGQLGVRTPKAAVEHLRRRAEAIRAERASGRSVLRDQKAPRSADELRTIERILENPEKVFTPELRGAAQKVKSRTIRLEKGDPGITSGQALRRRYQPLAIHLGIEKVKGESAGQFANRVRTEAHRQGLSDPFYFGSEIPGRARRADFALGGSHGATALPGRFRGRLFRAGVESTSPEVLVRGIARNIKRRHQWSMVADSFERHSFAWSRNKSIPEILLEAQRRGINPERLALYNPKIIRDARRGDSGEGTGAVEEAITDQALRGAFERNTITGAEAAANPQAFRRSEGFAAVPLEVLDELEVRTRANNLLGRVSEVGIQKASRIILGANPPWLVFQVISNAALTILGGAGPLSIVRAHAWWKKLSKEEKTAIEPYLGIGHFASDVRQTKLGAATKSLNEGGQNLVDAYRAIKATEFGQKVGRRNPLDVLFRWDNAQNNFFRRALFYSELRKAAYQRMNGNVTAAARVQNRVTQAMKLDPKEQMRFMARNVDELESHARYVSDFLGDYTSYTARERAIFKRHVMFYGYLRFSLRFAFWTMPAKHPVMTGLGGHLSRLSAEEIRELFGGDVLPFALGNIYLDGGKTVIELRRANPLLNALTEASDLRNVAGMLSPWYGMAASQVFRRELFTGKDFLVSGESTARRFLDIPIPERLRIAANQGFNMFFPTRTLGKITAEGRPQGADTLFFDPRPTRFAEGGEAEGRAEERAARFQKQGALDYSLRELVPFLPHDSEETRRVIEGLMGARAGERERLGLEEGESGPLSLPKLPSLPDLGYKLPDLSPDLFKLDTEGLFRP